VSSLAVTDAASLQRAVHRCPALLLFFSSAQCAVCSALEPKIRSLVESEFPRIAYHRVDIGSSPQLAAGLRLLAVPAVLAWFDGRETVRLIRHISVGALRDTLQRPYALLFEDGSG